MNESELDKMLNQWKAPEEPARMRANARAAYRDARPPRRMLPRLFALAAVAAAAMVFVVARATPQQGNVPYVVESEVTGGCCDSAHMTSYNQDGSEVMVSFFKPDNLVTTALGQLIRVVHGMPAYGPADRAGVFIGCYGQGCFMPANIWPVTRRQLLGSRCEAEGAVVGQETILGYPTVAVQRPSNGNSRTTFWRAPGLGCFALRVKWEVKDGGAYKTKSMKQALKVTVPAAR